MLATAAVELNVLAFGGIITSLRTRDRDGQWANIVLGYDTLDGYSSNQHYLGALIGRYANRIAKGRFELNGRQYHLDTNDGPNHLHGGVKGFHRHEWNLETAQRRNASGIRLTRTSPAGEEHYPGALHARVTYWLTTDNVLALEYEAAADAPTHVNLTQHTYFNLSGVPGSTVLDHRLKIEADAYLPVDATLIPLGHLDRVAGTPLDFRNAQPIGAQLSSSHEQLRLASGFDHTWVLNHREGVLSPAAVLYDETSGRRLHLATTEPGVQFYSGQWLDQPSGPRHFCRYEGLCLETQHFPDSPNRRHFPSTRLNPGERYRSMTTWTLGID